MKSCRKHLLFIASLAALTAACAPDAPPAQGTPAAATSAPQSLIDIAGMDRSVMPGDDFNTFASGGWLAKTEIPADRNAYGTSIMLVELTRERVAEIIRGLADGTTPADAQSVKVRDYYTAFMDEAGIEAKGLQPLAADFARIDALTDKKALARELGAGLRADVDMLNATDMHTSNVFGLWVAQDLDDPSRYATFLVQGGLGMLDRAYYLDTAPRMVEIRARYETHVANILKLAGIADETAKAKRIVALETAIAKVHRKREDNTNVARANNHWKRAEFGRRAPGLDWQAYFDAAQLGKHEDFVVWQPEAVTGIAKLVASEPLATWQDYLKFHAISDVTSVLPKAFVNEAFAFHGTTVQGTPQLRDRWKRAIDSTNDALGYAVGKLYVAKWFSPEAKARAEEMVHNLIAAFGARVDKLDWMTPETKAKAKAKLATLRVGVGYPETWIDYGDLTIAPDDAIGNLHRASAFDYQRSLAKLGKPVDRDEWVMTPQTVNAVNLPVLNGMNFPAAILQPPYFDTRRPVAMDYGATGALIGHEISHSFDNTGALFDAEGRLKNWWTRDDFAHFSAAGEKLVAQFNAYQPLPDLAINGKQTLGENIADVAGLNVAYDGYRLSQEGKPAVSAEGFDGDQLFFISYAQSWREKDREPFLRQLIVADGHAPDAYRAASVRNLDAWYAAFDVKPGQKLYLAPEERVRVW